MKLFLIIVVASIAAALPDPSCKGSSEKCSEDSECCTKACVPFFYFNVCAQNKNRIQRNARTSYGSLVPGGAFGGHGGSTVNQPCKNCNTPSYPKPCTNCGGGNSIVVKPPSGGQVPCATCGGSSGGTTIIIKPPSGSKQPCTNCGGGGNSVTVIQPNNKPCSTCGGQTGHHGIYNIGNGFKNGYTSGNVNKPSVGYTSSVSKPVGTGHTGTSYKPTHSTGIKSGTTVRTHNTSHKTATTKHNTANHKATTGTAARTTGTAKRPTGIATRTTGYKHGK